MRILKRNPRHPRVSLVLLDWSVRESFHILHYLKSQTVDRDAFEVIVIEYYDTVSKPLREFECEVDTWLLLEMPRSCYYHKHLMYNVGIVFSRGDIVMFGDSDAMVRPSFIETILSNFDRDPLIAYHMDEFRNVRRDLYPFNYPSFETVLGEGCINNVDGQTAGIVDQDDPMHVRNYGACMCARKQDLIDIGGSDEDMTYLGHICGPYDMTFRLMNYSRRMVWDPHEYLYHTWHPGTDGSDNYLGPHDGRNMSTTSFAALCTGRVKPQVENDAVRRLRTGMEAPSGDPNPELIDALIDPAYTAMFDRSRLGVKTAALPARPAVGPRGIYASHRGLDFYESDGKTYAVQSGLDFEELKRRGNVEDDERVITGASFSAIVADLDRFEARLIESLDGCNICAVGKRVAVVPHDAGAIDFRLPRHRENPRIIWVDTLAEAREKVTRIAATRVGVVAVATPAPAASHRTDVRQSSVELLRRGDPLHELMRRLDSLERSVVELHQSRIWRTLTAIGRVLEPVWNLFHVGGARR
jgi:hypothetical protein